MTNRINVLMSGFKTPFQAPDFAAIFSEDFLPAFEAAMATHLSEIEKIASNDAVADFANTIDALEVSGQDLDRVSSVFWNIAGTDSNEGIRAIERDISPRLAVHHNVILTNAALFGRIDDLFRTRDQLPLSAEQLQVLTKIHTQFIKGGARLTGRDKTRAGEIKERLAALGTTFSQNVLKDETDWTLTLTESQLGGLPAFLISTARAEAENRKQDGYVITLLRSSVEPFLAYSSDRDLRETAFRAWTARGDNGATDNKPLVKETLSLRQEYAKLLGYGDYAQMKLSDSMAKTAGNAQKLLDDVWPAAKRQAAAERDELLEIAKDDGLERLAPWDWRYYAEKLRLKKHALDEAVIKPYFQLDQMIEAAFACANRLFGLSFEPAPQAPVYHPDVRTFEVKDALGRHLALFYGDYFARPGKHSGAWMSAFRTQQRLAGDIRPIITNVMNFGKPAPGEAALLSFDDARTLFHEFGHALHGILSDVTYPSLAGTSVPRDFVELPSQLYEHWLEQPEVLGTFAIHAVTGETIPAELLDKLSATRTFNQGFMTVEYCASALIDLALHTADRVDDVAAFEQKTLLALGMPAEITMRHRTPHFSHVFSGEGYSAGYYSYLWSEVLDADAFRAFREAGNIFDPETARKLATNIYSAGHSRDPDDAYIAFRGRLPSVEALLEKRGLKAAA